MNKRAKSGGNNVNFADNAGSALDKIMISPFGVEVTSNCFPASASSIRSVFTVPSFNVRSPNTLVPFGKTLSFALLHPADNPTTNTSDTVMIALFINFSPILNSTTKTGSALITKVIDGFCGSDAPLPLPPDQAERVRQEVWENNFGSGLVRLGRPETLPVASTGLGFAVVQERAQEPVDGD